MKKLFFASICMVILSFGVSAETHLSDDIGGKVFEPSGNPFIVDQDIFIPKNTRTVFKAGCLFLFKSFTGINVHGSMLVEGTTENPIVFTSINDASYNSKAVQLPNAFDWNGIYVSEESGDIKFRNFKLMFSVFGIKSKKNQITLQNGQFKQNGQFHFTINDNIHYVQDNISYSYNVEKKEEPASTQTTQPVETEKKPAKKEKSKKSRGRKIAAFATLGVGLASGVAFIITGVKTIQHGNEMDDINAEIENSGSTPELKNQWETTDKKFKKTKPASIITGIVSGVSLPISLFLFVKKDKSTMTKKISLNVEAGAKKLGFGFSRYF